MSEPFSSTEANAIVRALRERRTTGPLRFDPDVQPDHDIVRDAVESARWAPNHKRTEPWRFFLLGSEQIRGMADVNAERMRQDRKSARLNSSHVAISYAVFCLKK